MFVVAGITGNTGRVVAETLAAAGHQVRGIIRNPDHAPRLEQQGYEVSQAELDNPKKLGEALAGADGAYLLVPPYFGPQILEHQLATARSIAQAIATSGVRRVVLLSSIGAERASGTGPIVTCHRLEQECADLPGVTFLRAAYFQENWLGVAGAAREHGVLPHFLPQGVPFAMVASADIGRTAAALLQQQSQPQRVVQLAGPENLTPAQVAEAFGQVMSKKVTPKDMPLSNLVETFIDSGVPRELAELFLELYQSAHAGQLRFEGDVLRGTTPLRAVLEKGLGVA